MMLIRYILVFMSITITYNLAFIISEDYPQDSKYWIKFHEEAESWHEARKMCDFEGGTLLSPVDEDSKSIIEMFANSSATNGDSLPRVYVGVHATISAAVWHSIEGTDLFNIKNYVDTQNLIDSQNQCAIFQSGSLIAVDCREQYPFICYKRDSDLTACKTSDRNYVFNSQTGSCYKYHAEAISWMDAYEACYREKAHLVVINSQTEAVALLDIAKMNPSSDFFSIGIIDWESDGNWYTIHGKKFQNNDYLKWMPGDPSGDSLYCGFMKVSEEQMTNRDCTSSNVPFICEKEI